MFCDLLHAKLVWIISLLYSKLLPAKLNLFGATFAEWHWQFFKAYVAALFVTSVCWLLSLRGLVDSA